MAGEQQDNELTDVVLCYQSMGIPFDASPATIEQRFKSLADEYRKKLASPDAAVREEARVSLELMGEMYHKIRTSITYHAMAKEHEKRAVIAAANGKAAARAVHKVVAEKRQMVNCPRCNGSITKNAKYCPICKSEIVSLPKQIMKALFTPRKLIVYGMVLLLGSLVALYVLRPELFPGAGAPAQSTEAPAQPTEAPAKTAGAPAKTAGAPAKTAGAPAKTTGAPAKTTGAPAKNAVP